MGRKRLYIGAAAISLLAVFAACDNGTTSSSGKAGEFQKLVNDLNAKFGTSAGPVAELDKVNNKQINLIRPIVVNAAVASAGFTLTLPKDAVLKASGSNSITVDGTKFTLEGEGGFYASEEDSLVASDNAASEISVKTTLRLGHAGALKKGTAAPFAALDEKSALVTDAALTGLPAALDPSAVVPYLVIAENASLTTNAAISAKTLELNGPINVSDAAHELNITSALNLIKAAASITAVAQDSIIKIAANGVITGIINSSSGNGSTLSITASEWELSQGAAAFVEGTINGTVISQTTGLSSGSGTIKTGQELELKAKNAGAVLKTDTVFAFDYQ
ncbi:MAG: hypothetical protein LBC77_01735 [Spirochaetaceae bacterium]|nr:hypothetical protein [Spirochaetaceae bacterium]